MAQEKDYLQDLTEIRSMMEKSTRFISLSGLSGVVAGTFALIGASLAHTMIGNFVRRINSFEMLSRQDRDFESLYIQLEINLLITALLVLVFALGFGYYFTARKAKKLGQKLWTRSSRQVLVNLFIPLLVGGIFCAGLFYHRLGGLIAPATLVFYGLALINGSKFTLDDIRYLGFLEVALGLICLFVPNYSLWFWAFGFGVLHIVYGISMYYKYEHKK